METKKTIFLYTDGAASGNPGPGGYGIVLKCGELRKEMSGAFSLTTNNRMELLAVILGLEAIKWQNAKVEIYSDSVYVVNSIAKNWKRKKNLDLWERFDAIRNRFDLTMHWIKGHNGNPENEICDQLAVSAYKYGKLGIDKGYII